MTAYVVAEFEVTDSTLADEYRTRARAAVAQFQGRYVVRPQEPETLEGEPTTGRTLVVIAFPDPDIARAWYRSDVYAEALRFARRSMVRRLVLVDGAGHDHGIGPAQAAGSPVPRTTRYAVNATSLPHCDAFEAAQLTAGSGATGLGLWEHTMPAPGELRDDALRAHLTDLGLRATFCVPACHLILPSQIDQPGTPSTVAERVDAISASIRRLARFDPVLVVVGPGASGDPDAPAGPVDALVEVLPELDAVAGECGVTLGLEVLAARRGSPLPTISSVVELLDRARTRHTRLMVSVFHSWDQAGLHAELRTHIDRIAGVQVCDVRDPERCAFDRELPGRGRGVAPEIMATLLAAGYDGWWELEIFSDDGTYGTRLPDSYWAMPPQDFLAAARSAFDRTAARAVGATPV